MSKTFKELSDILEKAKSGAKGSKASKGKNVADTSLKSTTAKSPTQAGGKSAADPADKLLNIKPTKNNRIICT